MRFAPCGSWVVGSDEEQREVSRKTRVAAKIVVCGDQEQTDKVLDAQRNDGGLPDLTTVKLTAAGEKAGGCS